MLNYKVLNQNIFEKNEYLIVPIRSEDRYKIMKWRNEQIYHLRQYKTLTREDQDNYFDNTISQIFHQEKPPQLLFSFLKNGELIGYGGLVHINWRDKNAEISFLMNTELEKEYFKLYWSIFLDLIEQLAFLELGFYKIFTYAYDLRPKLFEVLEEMCYILEARLKGHYLIETNYIDILIHSKMNPNNLRFRPASINDINIFFEWANDPYVRSQSYNSSRIKLSDHIKWFNEKISDTSCYLFVFENMVNEAVGQVRIQINNEREAIIGVSVDRNHRGRRYAAQMLKSASNYFLNLHPDITINAYIKQENVLSMKTFKSANYIFKKAIEYKGFNSLHFIKRS